VIRFSEHKRLSGMDHVGVPSVAGEFDRVELGDVRLRRRLQAAAARLSESPDLGFPRALKTERESEGFYRLLNNDRVGYRALVKAHALASRDRIDEGEVFRVIHDTTELSFGGEVEREGLGSARGGGDQSFFAHVALGVSCVGRPLGVLGAQCWARTKPPRGNRKLSGKQLSRIPDKESNRWGELVAEVEDLVGSRGRAIHVTDREGDSYPLFCRMRELDASFVIRMARDRFVLEHEDDETKVMLSEVLSALPTALTRSVPLSRRAQKPQPRSNRTHPARVERVATLAVRAGTLTLARPSYYDDALPETLALNVVYVQEVDVPENADAVSWVLLTSEPIATTADVEAVVDHYRARWLIEEFFKALKTGCGFEERQLESFQSLTNALAVFFPIAWQMLLLRAMSRADPDAPAETVLTPTQIKVLQHHQPQKMPLKGATVRDALYAVAGLGGHLKHNGPPGWRTLGYGMQDLLKYCTGWDLAVSSEKTAR
jgi:hypothetical protein